MAKYKSGEEAMVGDVVRCDDIENVTGLKLWDEYTVTDCDKHGVLVNDTWCLFRRFTLSRRAAPPAAQRPTDQQLIAAKFDALKELCLRKNADYGSTFARPPCLAPGVKASDAVLVRMSDKIGRLESLRSGKSAQVDESIADTVSDLSVYGILYLLAREKEANS